MSRLLVSFKCHAFGSINNECNSSQSLYMDGEDQAYVSDESMQHCFSVHILMAANTVRRPSMRGGLVALMKM